MPSDVVREDTRLRHGSAAPDPRIPEQRIPDPGQRPRAAVNPALGLKAEVHTLRTRLKTVAHASEDAVRLHDLRLREVEAFARSLEARLAAREKHLTGILDSFCWRATRPLRVAGRMRTVLIGLLKQAASRLYRAAPLPGGVKRVILDVLFRGAPALFRNSNSYRAWSTQRGRTAPHEVAFPPETAVSLAVPFAFTSLSLQPRVAVLCHVYHESVAPELAAYLANIPFPFGLYVTTDSAAKVPFITAAFGAALTEVRVVPNRGRDIAAKLLGFPEVYDRHEFVLHIHAKLSAHTDALMAWRGFLLENLLGSPGIVDSIFKLFAARPDVGLVAAQHFEPLRHWINWGGNFAGAAGLGRRMGLTLSETAVLDFPSGSMFWARTAALRPLLNLGLTFDAFEAEAGQADGTLAHAIERLFFHACEQAGLNWARIAHPPLFAATPGIAAVHGPGDLARFVPQRLRNSPCAPRQAAGAPVAPAPALLARLQDRALGVGRRVDADTAVVVGFAGAPRYDTGRATERATASAARALGQAGVAGRVMVRAGAFAVVHNSLMAEAFAAGADVYIAAAADGAFHPDAVTDLLRMVSAHDGSALIEAAPFPAGPPKDFNAVTLETPWAADACLVITRRVHERLGGFDELLTAPCAAIDYAWRARAHGFSVRCCPTALFTRPVALAGRAHLEAMLGAGLVLARKWGAAEVERRLAERLRSLGAPLPDAAPAPAPTDWRRIADFDSLAAHAWARA